MQIADDLLAANPQFSEYMLKEGKVPTEYMSQLLEQIALRPTEFYLNSAVTRQRQFGTDRDIIGSLESIVGYLDEARRKGIANAFRKSKLHAALQGQDIVSAVGVRTLITNASSASSYGVAK